METVTVEIITKHKVDLHIQRIRRMIVVGDSTKTDAKELKQSVISITGAHIVQGGTMAFSIAGKGKISTGEVLAVQTQRKQQQSKK